MRIMDLNEIRLQIGVITLGDKRFNVYERTLAQLLQHDAEFKKANQDLEVIRSQMKKAGDDEKKLEEIANKYAKRLNEWKYREIEIFIPELTWNDFIQLGDTQRLAVLDVIFGTGKEPPAANAETRTGEKKRKKRENKEAPGEKS